MAFSINSHVEGEVGGSKTLKNRGKTQKEKEKKKSKAEALQNCDFGSFPLSFLLLVLRPTQ